MTSADIEDWLASRAPNPWIELLQAAAEYVLETGGAETPVDSFIEWLAEWGREVRRRQRGLLLLTAHRAKGLEFDHVVVLDGGWDLVGRDEDADAPRRLYYVAMTRAKQSLVLMRLLGKHRFQEALLNTSSALLQREPVALTPPAPELSRRYQRLSLRDVFLSFGGYREPEHPVHADISALSPGDPLQARMGADRWELLDQNGTVAGQLARGFRAASGVRCACATVMAIVEWDRERSDPDYRDGLRCESWEVVVPEIVFEPVA